MKQVARETDHAAFETGHEAPGAAVEMQQAGLVGVEQPPAAAPSGVELLRALQATADVPGKSVVPTAKPQQVWDQG